MHGVNSVKPTLGVTSKEIHGDSNSRVIKEVNGRREISNNSTIIFKPTELLPKGVTMNETLYREEEDGTFHHMAINTTDKPIVLRRKMMIGTIEHLNGGVQYDKYGIRFRLLDNRRKK